MAQWLRVLVDVAKIPGSVSSNHIVTHNIHTSSFRESNTFLGFPKTLYTNGVHAYIETKQVYSLNKII